MYYDGSWRQVQVFEHQGLSRLVTLPSGRRARLEMGKIQNKILRLRLGTVPVDKLLELLEDEGTDPAIRECIYEILEESE